MSLHISNRWFRDVKKYTSHHVAVVDQPPRSDDLVHNVWDLGFTSDVNIPIYASLLHCLLEGFKYRWVTPPSEMSEQRIAPKQFIEEQLLNAVWKLVEIIDYFHNAGIVSIHPTNNIEPIDPALLEMLKVVWTRDPRICASSTGKSLMLIWTFVAGKKFPEPPPPAFNLLGATTTSNDRGRSVVTGGSGGPPNTALPIDNSAAVAIGLHNVIDDPFFEYKSAPIATQLVPCEVESFWGYRLNDPSDDSDLNREDDWFLRYLTLHPSNLPSTSDSLKKP